MRRPGHATLVAYLALFVALGGSSYAVSQLPRNSIGSKQLRKGGVYAQVCEGGDPLLIMSHVDDIGLMVHRIKPNGHLAVTNVGGLHAPDGRSATARAPGR